MTQKRVGRVREGAAPDETAVTARHVEQRDWSATDDLLDEIDALLAEEAAEREEREHEEFRDKLLGWAANQPRLGGGIGLRGLRGPLLLLLTPDAVRLTTS